MEREDALIKISAIEEIPERKCIVASVRGRLNSRENMAELDVFVEESISKGFISFILDFSGATFLCSTSLSRIVLYLRRLEEKGGRLIIYGHSEAVSQTFKLVNLHNRMILCRTMEEALAQVQR